MTRESASCRGAPWREPGISLRQRRKAKTPASVAGSGPVFSTQQDLPSVPDGVRETVLGDVSEKRAGRRLADDFGGDLAEAGEADGPGCARGEVEHPAMHERTAVIDPHY